MLYCVVKDKIHEKRKKKSCLWFFWESFFLFMIKKQDKTVSDDYRYKQLSLFSFSLSIALSLCSPFLVGNKSITPHKMEVN